MSWAKKAAGIVSKGSMSEKPKDLADLHRRRRESAGQFFTPEWISRGIWQSIQDSLGRDRKISVLDTSIGSGRLVAPADPTRCRIYGIDPDEHCINVLSESAAEAGIDYRLKVGGMEDLDARGFDLAIINPPFSLTLSSPNMEPFPCTTFGKFGPNTSAQSHEYALEQVLAAADNVVALLPTSMMSRCRQESRLRAIVGLEADSFQEEGASERTAVFYFCREVADQVDTYRVSRESAWPEVALEFGRSTAPRFWLGEINTGEPTITTPVTGDRSVRVEHHNRRAVLKFRCGFIEAKVRNALLVRDVDPGDRHRYPAGVRFIGDMRLSMDVWLQQDDPDGAFRSILSLIEKNGGVPIVSKTLKGYWRRVKREHQRAATPYRRWVKRDGRSCVSITAKRSSLLIPGNTNGPAIRRGETLTAVPLGGEYRIEKDGAVATLRRDELEKRFTLDEDGGRASADWELIEPGLGEAFPEIAHQVRLEMQRREIDWLWPFQSEGAIEHVIKPYGGVAAWKQGTGKARLAIALALLGGKHNLIVVESGLVAEMRREIAINLKLDTELWQIIDRIEDGADVELKKVNIISYNALKRRVRPRRTAAKVLRRRFHTVIADEGGILANISSQQSRAILALAPRKLIVADGTPIGNYPRSLYNVVATTAGQGVAHQPYSLWNLPFLEPRLLRSASFSERGLDRFRDRHVVLEWATNEFKEEHKGAKREVPRINNVVEFRAWTLPTVQRKVRYEPEVEPYAACPKPIFKDITVDWDRDHLAHYLNVAVHFVGWFQRHRAERMGCCKAVHLAAVVAKIMAVRKAASHPHHIGKNDFANYFPLTSKQRYAIDRVRHHIAAGKKTLLYAYSPATVERIATELKKHGIDSVVFHGGRQIERRMIELDERFRFGDTDALLSTWVGQKGLNLPQVKCLIKYDRDWTAQTEDQAVHRTQRPDQDERVLVERLHLAGSIDEYMAQVVEWKQAACDSGLDWGDGATEADVFSHMEAIIERFCHDIMEGSLREVYERLAA